MTDDWLMISYWRSCPLMFSCHDPSPTAERNLRLDRQSVEANPPFTPSLSGSCIDVSSGAASDWSSTASAL